MHYRSLAFVLVCLTTCVRGQDLSEPHFFITPELDRPKDVAVGDLDGDGDLDIVVGTGTTGWDGHIGVFFNDGSGAFGPQVRIADTDRPEKVALVDLDNDGDLDVTWVNWGTPDVAWCRNLGGGQFSEAMAVVDLFSANAAASLAWADTDNDGDLDLVTTSYANGTALFFKNTGTLPFTASQGGTSVDHAMVCAVADMDHDGDLDLVAGGDEVWWRDNQNGNFNGLLPADGGRITFAMDDVRGLALHDTENDGYPDVYIAENGAGKIWRYRNDGETSFSLLLNQHLISDQAPGVNALVLSDLNDNGAVDLLAACAGDHMIRFFESAWSGGYPLITGVYGATGMAVADLNNDGLKDVVTVAEEADEVAVHFNQGGTLMGPAQALTDIGGSLNRTRIADLDGDGRNDAVLNFQGSRTLAWKRNLSDGLFGPTTVIDHGMPVVDRMEPADLDGDGDQDLLAIFRGERLAWYRNDGAGGFGAAIALTEGTKNWTAWALGDVDNDGDLDIAAGDLTTGSGYYLYLLRNNGGGTFAPPEQCGNANQAPRDLAMTDVNGDGFKDLLAFRPSSGIHYLANNGAGSFPTSVVVATAGTSSQSYGLFGTDVDGDGLGDLLMSRSYNGGLVWQRSNGDGTFAPADTIRDVAGEYYQAIDVADMDGDGDVDVVVSSSNTERTKWFRNDGLGGFGPGEPIEEGRTAASLALGDLDGDGDPDILFCGDERAGWYENFIGSPYRIEGRIHYDVDADGTWSAGDVPFPFQGLSCQPSAAAPYSSADGMYGVHCDAGTYLISVPGADPWWQPAGPSVLEVTPSEGQPIVQGVDFRFVPAYDTLVVDVTASSAPPRCAVPFLRWVDVVNRGTLPASVDLELILYHTEEALQIVPQPDAVIGDHAYWHVELPVLGEAHFTALVQNTETAIGWATDSVLAHATAPGRVLDISVVHTRPVLCSYDPNDKQVEPAGYGPAGAVDIDTDRLIYTVRFQNTGTDTAYTVTVKDHLNEHLVPGSIHVLGSSHPLSSLLVTEQRDAVFTFDDILLPDSNANEAMSHGYVVFSAAIRPGAPSGTAIPNEARIFFDMNPPVVTNSTLTTLVDCDLFTAGIVQVDDTLSVTAGELFQWYLDEEPIPGGTGAVQPLIGNGIYTAEVTDAFGCTIVTEPYGVWTTGVGDDNSSVLHVVPNPALDRLELRSSTPLDPSMRVELIDLHGRCVLTLPGTGGPRMTIARGSLDAGLYLLRVSDAGRTVGMQRVVFR